MLKLEKELPNVIERIEILKSKTDVIAYREKLKAKGNYKDFTTRFVNDIKYAILTPSELCEWYDKYQCTDKHITSLMITACKQTNII